MATARTKKDITVEETVTAKTLATEFKVKEVEKEKKYFLIPIIFYVGQYVMVD